jgi:hypothetical protein
LLLSQKRPSRQRELPVSLSPSEPPSFSYGVGQGCEIVVALLLLRYRNVTCMRTASSSGPTCRRP